MAIKKPICDVDGFCEMLLASGLVDEIALARILADFRSPDRTDSMYGHSLTEFTRYLVANRTITCWQCTKLRNGQYKGFITNGYKLLDHLGDDDRCNRYLAEDLNTGRHLVWCVVPLSTTSQKSSKLKSWIEEITL